MLDPIGVGSDVGLREDIVVGDDVDVIDGGEVGFKVLG